MHQEQKFFILAMQAAFNLLLEELQFADFLMRSSFPPRLEVSMEKERNRGASGLYAGLVEIFIGPLINEVEIVPRFNLLCGKLKWPAYSSQTNFETSSKSNRIRFARRQKSSEILRLLSSGRQCVSLSR